MTKLGKYFIIIYVIIVLKYLKDKTMKIKFLTLFSLLLFVNLNLFATICKSNKGIKVNWTAFKTPYKSGVNGAFENVDLKLTNTTAKDLSSLLIGSTVKIKNTNVFTKNKARDNKLENFFFNKMRGEIRAIITAIETEDDNKGKLFIKVTMNNETKIIPMTYTHKKDSFFAKGFLDILDFSANNALKSINKACFDLHQGKTWSDVNISFELDIKCK